MDKTIILFNPSADRGRAAGRRDALANGLRGLGVDAEIIVTESEAQLRTLTRQLAAGIGGGILAGAGGDSTFSIMAGEIIQSGAGAGVRFGMVGLGSSNDVPAAFGLGTIEAACAALACGRVRRIDAGVVALGPRPAAPAGGAGRNADPAPETSAASRPPQAPLAGTIFLGQANVGLGAFVNRYVEELAARRPAQTRQQLLSGIRGVRAAYRQGAVPLPLRIETDSAVVEGEFDVAVFGNTRLWATGRAVVPEADPGDGRLDACLIRNSSFLRLIRIARLSRRGRHGRDGRVSFLRSPVFRIVSDRPFAVQADGEIVGGLDAQAAGGEAVIGVLPGALTLVV